MGASCRASANCKSITYFKSGWCSHFRTMCTNTKTNNKATSFRLDTASATTTTASDKNDLVWWRVGSGLVCDTSAGEVYDVGSPGKLPSLDECQASCRASANCKSI